MKLFVFHLDLFTVHFVEFYNILPKGAQCI